MAELIVWRITESCDDQTIFHVAYGNTYKSLLIDLKDILTMWTDLDGFDEDTIEYIKKYCIWIRHVSSVEYFPKALIGFRKKVLELEPGLFSEYIGLKTVEKSMHEGEESYEIYKAMYRLNKHSTEKEFNDIFYMPRDFSLIIVCFKKESQMKKRNITDTNLILQKYLQLIATGYSTGDFELLFEHLSDDCVWESQWRIDPESGKGAVESYFRKKGRLLMESKSYPECQIIQLVGNFKTVSDAKLHVNETPVQGSFGLWHEDGKYCLLMTQNLEGKISQAIVNLTLNENDLISRIDLCIPDLFKFEKIDTNLS